MPGLQSKIGGTDTRAPGYIDMLVVPFIPNLVLLLRLVRKVV